MDYNVGCVRVRTDSASRSDAVFDIPTAAGWLTAEFTTLPLHGKGSDVQCPNVRPMADSGGLDDDGRRP